MNLFRDSYTALLIVISVILLLTANAVLGVVLTNQSQNAMKELIHNRMRDISITAAAMLNGDELKALTKEDENTENYKKAMRTLAYFQENIELEYIYCIQPPKNGEFTFSIDPTVNDPGEFGSPIVATAALRKAATGVTAVDDEPYKDAWGKFYSSYSPVFASDGSLAGIVAVDFSADWYDNEIKRQEFTILVCVAVSLFMCIILVLLATAQMRKRVKKMTGDISEISGYLDELTREFSDHKENAEYSGDLSQLGERIQKAKDGLKNYIANINSKANNMITALGSDYRSVYYVDLDTDEAVCYQATKDFPIELKAGDSFTFSNAMKAYGEYFVEEEYRENFYKFVDPENIKRELKEKRLITHVCLINVEGRESYEMLRIAGAKFRATEKGNELAAVGLGFTNVDAQTRAAMDNNDALNNALEAAKSANIAKTMFLSNMSHEIRTPMNAIIGLNSMALANKDLPEKVREELIKVDSSAKHLLSLINDILDVSRIESGKVTIKKEEFALNDVLEQVGVIIGGQCKDKGINYNIENKAKNGSYIGDAMKLRQILLNILGNSVKFTPEGGYVTLSVEETAAYDDKANLIFKIADTGIGMSEEFLPKLFDAFSQADDKSTNRYGSTGLGMTITKSYIDLMGGKIDVTSKLGEGTTFTVTLALPKTNDEKEKIVVEEKKEEVSTDNLQGKTILVAEDMPVNAEIVLAMLEMSGMKGELAENGEEALKKFTNSEENYYAAILMDMRMPVMDGLSASKEIRKLERKDAKTIPIIALTANAFEEDVNKSIEAGINAHLSKPINPDEIFKTLARLVKV
ncbi:MAG: response regulator [Selenomonadaceae bacterium]|nr:response regulator [Selenomonadaceae bacterium]